MSRKFIKKESQRLTMRTTSTVVALESSEEDRMNLNDITKMTSITNRSKTDEIKIESQDI